MKDKPLKGICKNCKHLKKGRCDLWEELDAELVFACSGYKKKNK